MHGRTRLTPRQRYLFVVNHVSLLDTILMGALCWRSGCYPILVLGDKNTWHASWIKRALSSRIGFLLERGKINSDRISELEEFGRAGREFQLIVFPEGTRGDGVNVIRCKPGIYHIAQAARLPIVPVFIENMQLVSTKTGRFHPIRGWRKVEVHFGVPVPPEKYLHLPREEFVEFVRQSIMAARTGECRVPKSIEAWNGAHSPPNLLRLELGAAQTDRKDRHQSAIIPRR
ncbi:MAG: lysophospholipid acyltransferase family protein [Limisphaerales bacterium]